MQNSFIYSNNYFCGLIGNINKFFNFNFKFKNLFNNIYKALLEFIKLILQDIIAVLIK